jgi:hypothetical protein
MFLTNDPLNKAEKARQLNAAYALRLGKVSLPEAVQRYSACRASSIFQNIKPIAIWSRRGISRRLHLLGQEFVGRSDLRLVTANR